VPGVAILGAASVVPVFPLLRRFLLRFFDLLSSSLEDATGLRGSGLEGCGNSILLRILGPSSFVNLV